MHELYFIHVLAGAFCISIGCLTAGAAACSWGRLICGRVIAAEVALIVGWGVLCLVGVLAGCLAPNTQSVRLAVDIWLVCGLAALAASCLPLGISHRIGRIAGLARFAPSELSFAGRIGLVALPLLVAVWDIPPIGLSDSDTHWIPNLLYLADLGHFPRSTAEAPLSLYPAFPYGLQMLAYAGARAGAWLGGNDADPTAMLRTSLLLQLAGAAMLARFLHASWAASETRQDGVPPTWLAALFGFLLAIPLNPFFNPKVQLAPWGDAATAVALAASLISAREAVRTGNRRDCLSLALCATALAATKQANIALAAAVFLAAGAWSLRVNAPSAIRLRIVAAAIPCALTYLAWRLYVGYHLANGETHVMALGNWHFSIAGAVVRSMLVHLAKSPPELMLLAVGAAVGIREWRRPVAENAGLGAIVSLAALLYEAFLFIVYIAVFQPDQGAAATGFQRFNSHLSIALLLALAPALSSLAARVPWRLQRRGAAAIVVSLSLFAGIAMPFLARYDLTSGIADVADLSAAIVSAGDPRQIVAVAAPNEGAAFAAMRLGVAATDRDFRAMRFLDLSGKAASLGDITASGADLAVVSCQFAQAFTGNQTPIVIQRVGSGSGWRLVTAPPVNHRPFNVRTAPLRSMFQPCGGAAEPVLKRRSIRAEAD